MSADRVDKKWSEKGLKSYGTEAIVGTLRHYGVEVDEGAFKARAVEAWPLQLASEWQAKWKGVGQFARFPASAVEELWRRWLPEQAQPLDLVEVLAKLMQALLALRKGDATLVEPAFAAVDAVMKRIPDSGDRRERFVAEVVMVMSTAMQTLDLLAEALAKDGQAPYAERLVAVEESLFPVRKGVSRALVQAAQGGAAEAAHALQLIAEDVAREDYGRLAAVDALMHLHVPRSALGAVKALVKKAEQTKDGDLFEQLHGRLHHLFDALQDDADKRSLLETVEAAHRALDALGRKAH